MIKIPKELKLYLLYHRDVILPTQKYYVYTHKNPLTQKVFYVGSAKGNLLRAYDFKKHRNEAWKKEVISFGGTCNIIVEIVQYYDNPFEAQQAEYELSQRLKMGGEAYCSFEGKPEFIKKYDDLIYVISFDSEQIQFKKKTELYLYCKEVYGINRNIVNSLIEYKQPYSGLCKSAHGLRISKIGKEHM